MAQDSPELASVRYLVDDVRAATAFYTDCLGFTVAMEAGDAFADVRRGPLRLLLSGAASSGARATPTAFASPGANRIHLVVPDLDEEVARLESLGVSFASAVVSGPGGKQVLVTDPADNLVELFEAASRDLPRR